MPTCPGKFVLVLDVRGERAAVVFLEWVHHRWCMHNFTTNGVFRKKMTILVHIVLCTSYYQLSNEYMKGRYNMYCR